MAPARTGPVSLVSIGRAGFLLAAVMGCAGSSARQAGPVVDAGAEEPVAEAGARDLSPLHDTTSDPMASTIPPDVGAQEVGVVAPDGPASDAGSAPITGIAKIMVFGSSNEVITCWRAFLWQKLRAAGVTNFDFVGSMSDGPDCNLPGYDKDDESVSGTRALSITAKQFNARFKAHPPDIVLMHIGGGDLLDGVAPAKVIPAFTLALMQAREVNPQVRFILAQHTPEEGSGCGNCTATVMAFNALVVDWARQMDTPASPVSTVDLFTGLDLATDTVDRVHLNVAGSQKVSDRWLSALLPLFRP